MTRLLDVNVLIALSWTDHAHHEAAESWLSSLDTGIATCPVTQGGLLRYLLRVGFSLRSARQALQLLSTRRHDFWPDDLSYLDVGLTVVSGHRQVTDAYLAALARARGGRLATFDRGLALLHPDVAELVPS